MLNITNRNKEQIKNIGLQHLIHALFGLVLKYAKININFSRFLFYIKHKLILEHVEMITS